MLLLFRRCPRYRTTTVLVVTGVVVGKFFWNSLHVATTQVVPPFLQQEELENPYHHHHLHSRHDRDWNWEQPPPILTTTTTTTTKIPTTTTTTTTTSFSATIDSNTQRILNFRMPYLKSFEELKEGLPGFLVNYVDWHDSVRRRFPNATELLTHHHHPKAPKLLIRYTRDRLPSEGGGGLYDRIALGFLNDILAASRTKRLLMYLWHQPTHLTEFLAPNHIDWTVPRGYFQTRSDIPVQQYPLIYAQKQTSTKLATKYRNASIIFCIHTPRYPFSSKMAAERFWDKYNKTKLFANLWNIFFRPSPPIQRHLDRIWSTIAGPPGTYAAAHIRLLHPSFFTWRIKGVMGNPEHDGMKWNKNTQRVAVPPTIHALRCAVRDNPHQPVYLYSDWRNVVHALYQARVQAYIPNQTTTSLPGGAATLQARGTNNITAPQTKKHKRKKLPLDDWTMERMRNIHLLDSSAQQESANINSEGKSLEAYGSAYVDLYMAVGASCLSYGLGRFGYLAYLIARHDCINRHQNPHGHMRSFWNMYESVQTPMCTLKPDYPSDFNYQSAFGKKYWTHD